MAKSVVVVEAYHDEQQLWKLIKSISGEDDEIMDEANDIKNQWLEAGWPKDQIRVVKSDFRQLKRKMREDDD